MFGNPIISSLLPSSGLTALQGSQMGAARPMGGMMPGASMQVSSWGNAFGSQNQSMGMQQSWMQLLYGLVMVQLFQTLLQKPQPKPLPEPEPISPTLIEDRPEAKVIGDINYRNLNLEERRKLSNMSDRERAVLHLWGRQMIAEGKQDGGILLTVLESAQTGQNDGTVLTENAEVLLAQELVAKEKERFGAVTGRTLDEEFFKLYEKLTGKDISARYANAPLHKADGPTRMPKQFRLDSPEWESALQEQSGLNGFENSVLRLWGHNPLFTGNIDGSILAFTLANEKSLDPGLNKADVRNLLEADMVADGKLNGDALEKAFVDVMDKMYLGTEGASVEKTKQFALDRARALKRTAQQIKQSTTEGVQDAIKSVGKTMKDHPVLTGISISGLLTAAIICPFLAGLGMGGAGVAIAQRLIEGGRDD